MNSNKGADNRFNSYFQFIRPSKQEEAKKNNNNNLRIDTDPLGISYNTADSDSHHDDYYSDIFRSLNYPHDKTRSTVHDTSDGDGRRPSNSSNQPPPSLSPSPSPTSSSSSAAASPTYGSFSPSAVFRRDIPRNKCQIRKGSFTSPTGSVSAKSWEHMKSPAASFLASFASPVLPPAYEEDGDEIDDYVFDKIIGYGGFSTVRSGYSISDGHKVAVKVIKKSDMDDVEQARLERELDIWKSLDHPNLVMVEKVLETDHAMYIVCTYCGGGSLLDRVNKKVFTEDEARAVIIQLCHALQYLHEQARVCHKDLKLENVLLDDVGNVKICDFGLAVYQAPLMYTQKSDEVAGGSLAYAAPEQVRSDKPLPSPCTDLWSLGVLLFALVTGRLPFQDSYDVRLQRKILEGEYQMPDNLSDELQQLLRGLLQVDPQKRYTVRQILHSPWCSP
ncbi:kinase-like domain-containing protein [Fennellomyces sp. T-0311]|nr:kinase-like domain-containing protein [Fennellomyces sp. T-0311]